MYNRVQGQSQGEPRSRFGSAMKAVRRRAAGAQILMTEHVEQLWLTGYKCAAVLDVPSLCCRVAWSVHPFPSIFDQHTALYICARAAAGSGRVNFRPA